MFTRKNKPRDNKKTTLANSKDTFQNELLKIASFVLTKVTDYAPYSSNLNIIEGTSEEQPIHLLLWINTMRARNDKEGIRQLIYNWNIDISSTEPDVQYETRLVKINNSECNIAKLAKYLENNCEPDEYHLLFDDELQLVEIQCSLTDLNNYVYDEIAPLDFKEKRKDGSQYSSKERNETIALRLAQWGIGNCSDLAQAAMAMLMHYPTQGFDELKLSSIETTIPVEIVTLQNDDHEFIVINRKAGTNLNNPNTWGHDVVILDPWLRECYLLDDVLSGSRTTLSVELIFSNSSYSIENKGLISEGASEHWNKSGVQQDIFNLKTRAMNSEERITWAEPAQTSFTMKT